jgi:hypothetical protein
VEGLVNGGSDTAVVCHTMSRIGPQ